MRPEDREAARRQIDKRLSTALNADALARPPRGWVKAIREALGMTTAQLAKRLGVSQPRVVGIEQAEAKGAITLDCRLVYALVPRKPLDALVEERAARLADRRLASTRHTMALEAQAMDTRDEDEQRKRLIRKLIEQAGSELWDDA
ncbi:MAG: mobile mystery protein A [Afipia sp.]|nr:mobile mystery protein A [Afipia sp.]